MAVPLNITLGILGVTDFVLVVLRRTDTGAEVDRQSFGPSPTTIIYTFTVDPIPYFIDLRISPDGTALGSLLATYTVDGASNQIISEKRYYTVGGPGTYDPADGDTKIIDPYFIGKNITGVFQEGFRPLKPVDEWTFNATPPTDEDTIELINGHVFSTDEVVVVEITYKSAMPVQIQTNLFTDVKKVTASVTLDSTYNNCRIQSQGATSVLAITFPDIATIQDGTFFYLNSCGGNNLFTRLLTTGTDKFYFDAINPGMPELTEISFGKGEHVWVEVRDGVFEVISISDGALNVGDIIVSGVKDHVNAILENGQIGDFALDGDEYPRLWWYIKNMLPATHVITDDNVILQEYVHPASRVGQFVMHSTLKKFRTPNTQGLSMQNLKDYLTYGGIIIDPKRTYNYPGGFKDQAAMPHNHFVAANVSGGFAALTATNSIQVQNDSNGDYKYSLSGRATTPTVGLTSTANNGGENTVKNVGVITFRRA